MPFTVTKPRAQPTPVVVEVPHAGLGLDPIALATLAASARSLGFDADLYADRLYADAPDEGATLLVSNLSRYVCDLNRAAEDVDSLAVEGAAARAAPHGFVWRTTTEGRPAQSGPLSRAEYERRVELYHRPYHRALRELLDSTRQRFGYVVLLCAHTMPSRGRDGHDDAGSERADVVPGTRGRSTASGLVIDAVEQIAKKAGLSVEHDRPYQGGYSTFHYGRPAENVHAIQIELARRLYMNERTLEPLEPRFSTLKAFCRSVVRRLGELELTPPPDPRGTPKSRRKPGA